MGLYDKLVKDLSLRGMDVVVRGTSEDVTVSIQDQLTHQVIMTATEDSVEAALSKAIADITTRATNSAMLSVLWLMCYFLLYFGWY